MDLYTPLFLDPVVQELEELGIYGHGIFSVRIDSLEVLVYSNTINIFVGVIPAVRSGSFVYSYVNGKHSLPIPEFSEVTISETLTKFKDIFKGYVDKRNALGTRLTLDKTKELFKEQNLLVIDELNPLFDLEPLSFNRPKGRPTGFLRSSSRQRPSFPVPDNSGLIKLFEQYGADLPVGFTEYIHGKERLIAPDKSKRKERPEFKNDEEYIEYLEGMIDGVNAKPTDDWWYAQQIKDGFYIPFDDEPSPFIDPKYWMAWKSKQTGWESGIKSVNFAHQGLIELLLSEKKRSEEDLLNVSTCTQITAGSAVSPTLSMVIHTRYGLYKSWEEAHYIVENKTRHRLRR